MVISNGNPTPKQIAAISKSYLTPVPKAPSALSAPIISRIHNVQPGCGSCGRK